MNGVGRLNEQKFHLYHISILPGQKEQIYPISNFTTQQSPPTSPNSYPSVLSQNPPYSSHSTETSLIRISKLVFILFFGRFHEGKTRSRPSDPCLFYPRLLKPYRRGRKRIENTNLEFLASLNPCLENHTPDPRPINSLLSPHDENIFPSVVLGGAVCYDFHDR